MSVFSTADREIADLIKLEITVYDLNAYRPYPQTATGKPFCYSLPCGNLYLCKICNRRTSFSKNCISVYRKSMFGNIRSQFKYLQIIISLLNISEQHTITV